jgi:hypothetical protein
MAPGATGPWFVNWLNVYNSPEQTFVWRFHAPAHFHEAITTFSYGDGHVAAHKWTDPTLIRGRCLCPAIVAAIRRRRSGDVRLREK